jgi:hypothetical protein
MEYLLVSNGSETSVSFIKVCYGEKYNFPVGKFDFDKLNSLRLAIAAGYDYLYLSDSVNTWDILVSGRNLTFTMPWPLKICITLPIEDESIILRSLITKMIFFIHKMLPTELLESMAVSDYGNRGLIFVFSIRHLLNWRALDKFVEKIDREYVLPDGKRHTPNGIEPMMIIGGDKLLC